MMGESWQCGNEVSRNPVYSFTLSLGLICSTASQRRPYLLHHSSLLATSALFAGVCSNSDSYLSSTPLQSLHLRLHYHTLTKLSTVNTKFCRRSAVCQSLCGFASFKVPQKVQTNCFSHSSSEQYSNFFSVHNCPANKFYFIYL